MVWEPYRFRPGLDCADSLGRSSDILTLEAHASTRLAVPFLDLRIGGSFGGAAWLGR
ncbi:hypothetical protein ACSCBZ_41645 [Streptomyces niveiscabiei]|uniref:hypothetical protein n=1 Tax=Streptomyces niveiscabiei TaxID=164115 RepID=UPI000A56297B|nr:hypothetical protein [Streptomyces niveiscabiei]